MCLKPIEISVAGSGESTAGEEGKEVCVGVCVCRSHRTWLPIIKAFLLILWRIKSNGKAGPIRFRRWSLF